MTIWRGQRIPAWRSITSTVQTLIRSPWWLWVSFAILVTWPVVLSPSMWMVGDPRIDVWNHAWGYWWVAECLKEGTFPFRTELLGGPQGGVLFFVDLLGAVLAAPVTWSLGPAVAYNLVLMSRVAMAGFAGERLSRELTGSGPQGWIAGTLAATTPFQLSELGNGITEVCVMHWLIFTLWATARALRCRRMVDWGVLGLFQGLTFLSNFYYGLMSGLLALVWVAATLVRQQYRQLRALQAFRLGVEGLSSAKLSRALLGALLSVSVAGALMAPVWWVFSASVKAPDALVLRSTEFNKDLIEHNAVDPQTFIRPLDFQSVDLREEYGEYLRHTGYLRLTVIALAAWAVLSCSRLRILGALGGLSAVLGMGNHLYFCGEFVTVHGQWLSLPFEWLLELGPDVVISHPLRLSIGAQVVACVLAGTGASEVARKFGSRAVRRLLYSGVVVLCVAESLFASSARWPLPRAEAEIATFYRNAPPGMVLELPAEVGTTMRSSRYLWHQTVHRRPIPYTPDARAGTARDQAIFGDFRKHRAGGMDRPAPPSDEQLAHLRQYYGMVVVHRDLEAEGRQERSYVEELRPALGEPWVVQQSYIWFLGASEQR